MFSFPMIVNSSAVTTELTHTLLTFPSFLINTLLAGQGSSIMRRVFLFCCPLPQDAGGVLTGAKPLAGRGLVVTRTKGLGDPGAPSGQADPPAMPGAQLSSGAGAQRVWSPGDRSFRVWVWRGFPQGWRRNWCTAEVWNGMKTVAIFTCEDLINKAQIG